MKLKGRRINRRQTIDPFNKGCPSMNRFSSLPIKEINESWNKKKK